MPDSLAMVKGLKEVDLSSNDLSGEIPDFTTESAPSLTTLILSDNELQGASLALPCWFFTGCVACVYFPHPVVDEV